MPKKDIIHGAKYHGYELAREDHSYSQKYLAKAIDIVETMTDRHRKTLVTRFDIRYPKTITSDGSNTDFKHLTQNLTKEFSRKGYDPQYMARREQKQSKNPHYHMAIVLDGSKKRDRNSVIETVEHHWSNVLGISPEEVHEKQLVYPCNKDYENNPRPNGYLIEPPKQNDIAHMEQYQQNKNNAIKQLSYMAKIDPEDMTSSSTRKIFTSQYKKDFETAQENKAKWRENYYKNRERNDNDSTMLNESPFE